MKYAARLGSVGLRVILYGSEKLPQLRQHGVRPNAAAFLVGMGTIDGYTISCFVGQQRRNVEKAVCLPAQHIPDIVVAPVLPL